MSRLPDLPVLPLNKSALVRCSMFDVGCSMFDRGFVLPGLCPPSPVQPEGLTCYSPGQVTSEASRAALGEQAKNICPERASHGDRVHMRQSRALTGRFTCVCLDTQGGALGFSISALWAAAAVQPHSIKCHRGIDPGPDTGYNNPVNSAGLDPVGEKRGCAAVCAGSCRRCAILLDTRCRA